MDCVFFWRYPLSGARGIRSGSAAAGPGIKAGVRKESPVKDVVVISCYRIVGGGVNDS